MALNSRDDRTARLAQRLEELARAVGRSDLPEREAEKLLELTAMATVHAAALELLTRERAGEIWAAAAEGARPPRRQA